MKIQKKNWGGGGVGGGVRVDVKDELKLDVNEELKFL